MEYILIKLLVMTISGTAVFGAVTLVQLLCRSFPRSWYYYIYLLPLAAFLFAVPPSNAVTKTAYTSPAQTASPASVMVAPAADTLSAAAAVNNGMKAAIEKAETAKLPIEAQEEIQAVPRVKIRTGGESDAAVRLLFWIYVCGAAFMLARRVWAGIRLAARVRSVCADAPVYMTDALERVKKIKGIKRNIRLYGADVAISPFMYGIMRPKVVMPLCIGENETEMALMHELTHIKRGDLLYKLAVHIVCALHWFNPIVYVMSACVGRECELSCDEASTLGMNGAQRKNYSLSILRLMKNEYGADMKNAVCMAESVSKSVTRKRLEVIMMTEKRRPAARIASIALAAVMTAASVCTAYAVNLQSPVDDTYVVVNTDKIGVFEYIRPIKEGEKAGVDDGTGSGKVDGKAALINTPLRKAFSMSGTIATYRMSNGSYKQEDYDNAYVQDGYLNMIGPDRTFERRENVPIEIVMDKYTGSMDAGSIWTGLFTVKVDGNVVMDKCAGYIEHIPYAEQYRRFTSVTVLDESTGKTVLCSRISFGLSSEDMMYSAINEQRIRDMYERDKNPNAKTLELEVKSGAKTAEEENGVIKMDIYPDINMLGFGCDGIETYNKPQYTYSENAVNGILHKGYEQDFEAEITGVDGKAGDTVTVRSKDGTVNMEFTIKNVFAFKDYADNYDDDLSRYNRWLDPTTGEEFDQKTKRLINDYSNSYQHKYITTAEFPFDIKLSDDKSSVTLTKKDAFDCDAWFATMATYNMPDEWNIWVERVSYDNAGGCVFPAFNDGSSRHYINVSMYSSEPYGRVEQYEIAFFMYDDILYTQGSKGVYTMEQLHGAEFERFMKQCPYTSVFAKDLKL